MMERHEKKLIIILAVAVSFGVHLWALHAFSLSEPSKSRYEPRIIELVSLPEKTIEEIKEPEKLEGQVVDLGPEDPDDRTPPPETARYFSERNMRTEKETVKISRARTGSPGIRAISGLGVKKSEEKTGSIKGKEIRAGGGKGEEPGRNLKKGSAGSPVKIAKNDPKGISAEDLMISLSDLEHVLGADDGSIDHLPGVTKGEITVLNARAFTYASLLNRMKKIVYFYWEGDKLINRIGYVKISTTLWIVLDADGSLVSVDVINPSGYPIWDATAIKAIRKASPFYNIPPALLDENGHFGSKWEFFTY
jgi:TonB family protein